MLENPQGLSITNDDVLYICDTDNSRIVVVHLDSDKKDSIIDSAPNSDPLYFNYPQGVIATNTSLYVLDRINYRVEKLSLNGSNSSTILSYNLIFTPYYFYVHNDSYIYLSDVCMHEIVLFRSNESTGTVVAGNGTRGSSNAQLSSPYGVFVKSDGTIYVADYANHRIMKWTAGATEGIRVAGDQTPGSSSLQLYNPTYVTVDTNEYMYISEDGNHRIIRWAPNSIFGVCIAACVGTTGTGLHELKTPVFLAFDSNGSLYVADSEHHRVQKFTIRLPSRE